MEARWILAALLVLGGCLLGGCRQAPAPTTEPEPAERWSDEETRVWLEAPGPSWTLLHGEDARAHAPEAVAALSDGSGCVGVIRVRDVPPDARLESLARALLDALRAPGDRERRFDRVPYVGRPAIRFALEGQRDGARHEARVTLVLATDDDGQSRLYEVRATSDAPAHVMARRCFDAVTAAFDLLP